MPIICSRPDSSEVSMKGIDTRIAIQGMAASFRTGSQSESRLDKLTFKENAAGTGPGNAQRYFVETDLSFSTYGARNERVAVVVKNKHTGEVIREIPSKEMQKLHVHLDMLI